MKKWWIIGGSLLALLLVLAVGLVVAYRTILSKNFLAAQIEKSIDSRVQIGDFRVSLFSVPATVVIEDVIITERDELARDGVAHDKRVPIEGGPVRIEEIGFDLSLRELLAREINVSKLRVRGAHFDLEMDREGKLNIESLFAAPPETEKDAEEDPAEEDAGKRAFVTQLDRLLIEDGSFELLIEKTGLEVVGKGLRFDLKDIRVDPNALEKVNEAHLDFEAQLEAFSAKKGRQKYGQIGLEGPARVRLFDPTTGKLDPDAEIDFAIHQDSYVSSKAPYISKLWSVTDALHKIGLKDQALPDRLTFGRDRVLDGRYRRNRIELRQAASLMVEDWELILDGGSWVELGTEQHSSSVLLLANAKLSDWTAGHLAKLSESAPERVRASVLEQLRAPLFVEDRLTLKASTSGPLSDPKVTLETRLPDIGKLLREVATDTALEFLFQKLNE